MENAKPPITYALFGSTGDLAQKKILPALFSLFLDGFLPMGSEIIAYSRRSWSDVDYQNFARPFLNSADSQKVEQFLKIIRYCEGNFDQKKSYQDLKDKIRTTAIFFHLAVQPIFYEMIVEGLAGAGLDGILMVEKPFGHDEKSAIFLEESLEKNFSSDKILRIDHYLGKDGLRAMLTYRNENQEFEEKLNHNNVESIKARLVESIDIIDRGEFYDATGALLDVGQNHLLMMLACILLSLGESAGNLSKARAKSLEYLGVPNEVLRAQYEGYRQSADVSVDSQTETYFKIKTYSLDPRFKDVPIELEGGKAMKEKRSTVAVSFKDGSQKIFNIEEPKKKDAYENIILSAVSGDKDSFVSLEEVRASWAFIDRVKELLEKTPLYIYPKGEEKVSA